MSGPLTKDDFWSELKGVNAGMLGAGSARHVPMSHYAEPDRGLIWFITAKGTDLAKVCAGGAQSASYILAAEGKLSARIEGQLEAVDDPATLHELWNVVADAWFEGGPEDPDAQLLRLTPSEAEVWITPGGLGFLYQIAKARVTGAEPDMGQHGTLSF